jgi:hypothetical protein
LNFPIESESERPKISLGITVRISWMSAWRKIVLRYKSICWMLIAGFFVLAMFPAHLHYYHNDAPAQTAGLHEPGGHEHEVDLHVLADFSHQDHEPLAHVFKVSPDVVKRNSNDYPTPVLLFIILLTVIPVIARKSGPRPPDSSTFLFKPHHHLTPPLRAPPGY